MSIIYEALRKTQRNREVRKLPTRERVAARNLDWLDKALLAVIILLLVVGIYLYLPHIFKHHTPLQTEAVAKPVVAVTPVTVPAVPVPAAQVQNNLTLNGVLISTDEKIALINKKTFHLGDNVNGMRIVRIEFDRVELDNAGSLVTLRTSS